MRILVLTLLCLFIPSLASQQIAEEERSRHIFIDDFLFDTGAEISAIIRWDKISYDKRRSVGEMQVSGWMGDNNVEPLYLLPKLELAGKEYPNTLMLGIDTTRMEPRLMSILPHAVMGMNVISKYNWVIDFEKNTVKRLDYNEALDTKGYTLRLDYKNKAHPLVSARINNIQLNDLLIDTGAEYALSVPKNKMSDFLKNSKVISTERDSFVGVYDLLRNSGQEEYYYIDALNINDVSYKGRIDVVEAGISPSLGINFFRLAKRIVLDTENRVLYML